MYQYIKTGTAKPDVFKLICIFILGAFALLCILPLILVIAISLSEEKDIYLHGYSLMPAHLTIEAYKLIFERPGQILSSYMITIIVTVGGTCVSLLVTALLAYVICRRDYPLARLTTFIIFFPMLISGGLVPWYILISRTLSLKDSIFSLILPYLVVPWNVILMKGFMSSTPMPLIESAKIDGASELRIFFRIVAPVNSPGIATVGLFIALMYWNDYYLSLMFIETSKNLNLQFLLYRILANLQFLTSALAQEAGVADLSKGVPTLTTRMAMCILAAGPMMFVFPFFQKYFVKGLVVGGIKG